ncbi:MAG: condensation domain-containing protein, partial [Ruminococcus sp.]|nr:condensation domain-containing protein [Ruminococcus sp.]
MNRIISTSNRFPLTNIQQAYFMGRNSNFEFGGIPTYVYYEFKTNLKYKDFERSLNNLICNQPMLRANIVSIQEQTIVDTQNFPYYKVPYYDISNLDAKQQQTQILEIREKIHNQILNKKDMFLFSVAQMDNDTTYIFCYVDMLVADAFSLGILLDELKNGCNINDTVNVLENDFYKYVELKENKKNTKRYLKDKEYWLNRLDDIPNSPNIPIKNVSDDYIPKTKRISINLDISKWENIKRISKIKNVPPTTVILTAYSMVLGFWSNQDRFTINMPISDRPIGKKSSELDMSKVIGDFTSVMLIEVDNITVEKSNFWQYAELIKNSILKSFKHRLFDGTEIMREIGKLKNSGDKALMPYVFTSMLLGEDTFSSISNFGDIQYSFSQTPQVFIDCQAMERDGSLFLTWDYVMDLFDDYN